MGKFTVQFKCHNCGHCCTDVVCRPTVRDAVRIATTWLECGDERYIMVLRQIRDRCFFLRKKKKEIVCSIYDSRPILCRLFTFRLQTTRSGAYRGFTLHKDCDCPRYRDGLIETEPLYRLYREDDENQEDYEAMVRVFNSGDHDSRVQGQDLDADWIRFDQFGPERP